jgi:hypothetical protein
MIVENTERREFILGASQAAIGATALAAIGAPTAIAKPIASKGAVSVRLPKGGTSQFAQINGIRMHYVTAGTGPAVVLLHGWPQTWFAWHGTIERLSRNFTVIAPDLRGTGLSEKPLSGMTSGPSPLTFRA